MEDDKTIKWDDWFTYDETSPSCLRWRVNILCGRKLAQIRVHAGDSAGSIGVSGYYSVGLQCKTRVCHRIIMEMSGTALKRGDFVDHIDGVRSNNLLGNLRIVDRSLNSRNTKMQSNNSSGFTGVKILEVRGSLYWSAQCSDASGERMQKLFPLATYGNDKAFEMACEWRKDKISVRNLEGAGYTTRHGAQM
jgi:hypothetical protein